MGANRASLVELVGQPGVGKTTLAHLVAGDLKSIGKADLGAAWRRLPFAAKASLIASVMLDPACLVSAFRLVVSLPLLSVDSLARLARLVAKSHWTRSHSGRLLLEEGYLQDLWSICYSAGKTEPDPRLLAPIIRCLYREIDARVVLLEIDPESAFDRIRGRARGRSRLDRLNDPELRRSLTATAQLPRILADAARLAGLKVATLDMSQSIEAAADDLRDMMRENYRGSRGKF